jgi:hypothetical protein
VCYQQVVGELNPHAVDSETHRVVVGDRCVDAREKNFADCQISELHM